MSKPKFEITAETIQKIISDKRPTSLTEIAHALGHKGSISGSLSKLIRSLVPSVADLLAANKPANDAKGGDAKPKVAKKAAKDAAGKKTVGKTAFPVPDCCPFRHSEGNISGYAQVFSIIHHFGDKGVSKSDLLKHYRAWSKKPEANCLFDITVVTSPREDGSAHRSASKAADRYWVERENGWFRLHLRNEKA